MKRTAEARWTRRHVLRSGSAACLLGVAGIEQCLGVQEPGSKPSFKLGIQSYSLRDFDEDKALQLTQDLGLHYWESYPAHIPLEKSAAEEHRSKAEGHKVKVVGYGVLPFTKDHDANRRAFEFGKALGVEYFSADPQPDSFDSLDKLVEEYGIAIGIHNHGPGHKYAKITTIRDAIKDHHPRVGCCIDTGHFLRSNEDPVEAAEAFRGRIYGVHLKDVKDATKFTILGKGDLRTADLLKELAKQKYGYCLAIEYEENPKDPIADIKECLAFTRAALPQ